MNFKNGVSLSENDGQPYGWSQTINDLTITLFFDHDITLRNLDVSITPTQILVREKLAPVGEYLINGQFFQPVKVEHSSWLVDDKRYLVIDLVKRTKSQWWESAIVGHKKVDSSKLEPETTSDISDLDDETQTMVRKIMFDNQQKQRGLPTSEEMEKQNLLKKFAAQHPEYDFSKAKIQ